MVRTLVLAAILVTGCSHWPPVVQSVADVERLPSGQPDVRCIGCGQRELEAVAQRLRGLEYLFLNSESSVTDQGIGAVSTLASLRQVVVKDASQLSDASAVSLSALPSLRELMLYDACGLSDKGVAALEKSRSLRTLYLVVGRAVSEEALQQLRARMPDCSIRVDRCEEGRRPTSG